MREMLERVAAGELTPEQAEGMLAGQGFTDLGFAKVDTQRAARTGAGEVVYGAGKTAEQIAKICPRACCGWSAMRAGNAA